jgi:hypothetical protein
MKKILALALLTSSIVSTTFKSYQNNYSCPKSLTKISTNDEQDGLIIMCNHQKSGVNLLLEDSIYNVNKNKISLKDSYLLNNWENEYHTLTIVLYFNHNFAESNLKRIRLRLLLVDYLDSSKTFSLNFDEDLSGDNEFLREQHEDYSILLSGDHIAISVATYMLGEKFILQGGLESGFLFELGSDDIPDFKIDKSMLLVDNDHAWDVVYKYPYLAPEYTRYGSSEVYLDGDVYDLTSDIDNPLTLDEIISKVTAYDYGDRSQISTTYVDNGYQNALVNKAIGTYPIIFSATDSSNHTTTLTINIHLSDIKAPTLKIKDEFKDENGYLALGVSKCGPKGSVIDLSSYFELSDNYDSNPLFIETPKITYSSLGQQVLTVKFVDSSNNSNSEDITVRIFDDICPTIKGKDIWDLSLGEYASSNELLKFYSLSDNVEVTSSSITDDTFTGHATELGTYYFTINAKDAEGNLTTKVVTVNVSDEEGPVFFINEISLTLQDDEGYKNASTMLQYLIDNKYLSPTYQNAEYVTFEYDENYYKPGKYKVIIKCLNQYGNKEYISLNLTINESIKSNTETVIKEPNFFVKIGTWSVSFFVAIGNIFISIWNHIISWFK